MNDTPETPSEVSPRDAAFWLDEIEAAQARFEGWYRKADEADERYRDDDDSEAREFGGLNVLWANVETQKAAIGEDFGKPQVTRINMPEDDDGLARHVATVWERAIDAAVKDSDDNHDIALAVGDVFLPGKGQVWLEVEADKRRWVKASICRVCFRDYLEGPTTRWGSVPWVARRHFFVRDELVSECRLSEEEAAKVPLNSSLPHSDKSSISDAKGKEQFKRAEVWEIWSKFPEKARLYVAVGYKDKVLRYDRDPLSLKGFFPCPRPLLANGDESKPPLTDYSRYQDQADELDRLSQRIYVLTETLRRVGIRDSAFEELAELATAEENSLVAVTNWSELQQKGGLNRVVEWVDIIPIAQVLAELHKQRDTLLNLIYELSGISDLARGSTDPDETATAQNLKASFGSSRFKRREKESRRFASEAYAIKGEVIAELFPREQLEQMTGIAMPKRAEIEAARAQFAEMQAAHQQAQQIGAPLPQFDQNELKRLAKMAQTRFAWEDISGVLRSDVRRCYSVAIETDQTAFQDAEADKQNRTQFFQAVMQAMQQVGPMIMGNPKNGEIFKQLIMFVISSFKAGRGMEEGIEAAIDAAIEQATQQQGQQQQDPKAMADMQIAQARVQQSQIQLQTAQIGLQRAQIEAQQVGADIQLEGVKVQQKAVQEAAKTQAVNDQAAAKRAGHQIDMQNKAEKLAFDRATRATAQEALLYGPTQAPAQTNGGM